MKRFFLPVFLLGLATSAFGEGGCPDGQFPRQNGPVMMCVPGGVPGGSDSSPPAVWADRWGAIATDGKAGSLGFSTDMESKRKAEKAAMADCQAKGGTNCELDIAYYNQCAVVVTGENTYLAQSAATEDLATSIAMGKCQKGNTNCRVLYTGCSTAVRIN
ncbi:DUF4189 domain-containing protein [Achromobacter xylosoxidans]